MADGAVAPGQHAATSGPNGRPLSGRRGGPKVSAGGAAGGVGTGAGGGGARAGVGKGGRPAELTCPARGVVDEEPGIAKRSLRVWAPPTRSRSVCAGAIRFCSGSPAVPSSMRPSKPGGCILRLKSGGPNRPKSPGGDVAWLGRGETPCADGSRVLMGLERCRVGGRMVATRDRKRERVRARTVPTAESELAQSQTDQGILVNYGTHAGPRSCGDVGLVAVPSKKMKQLALATPSAEGAS